MLALVTLFALLWPGEAGATTDGDEPLVVLGLAPADGKLYLARFPDNGGEDPPELYYVVLDGPSAGRLVTVKSWYRDLHDDPDGLARDRFDAKFIRLKRRLQPAKTIAPVCTASAKTIKTSPVADPWIPEWDTEYELEVSARHPGAPGTTATNTVTAYGDWVGVVAEIRVPGKPFAVVLVRYFSKAYEYGYHSDVALVVPLSAAATAKGETAPAVEYLPYGDPDEE